MDNIRKKQILGFVDEGNSTATPLVAGDSFVGTPISIKDYAIVFINVYSDVASATDGLIIEQSSDGINFDHDDVYTLPAGGAKNYAINPYAKWLRVTYTNNASTPQGAFRLQTILKGGNCKPSSHRVQDNITAEDDVEVVKSVLAADSGDGLTIKNINPQHPLPVDGDQVYEKDIDQSRSTSDGWTGGEVIDLVNDNYTTLVNANATNPKVIYMEFKRPLQTSVFGITTPTGDFSNTKITGYIGLGADQIEFVLIDESADNTKKTVLIPDIAPATIVAVKIEFFTADTCTVSANIISKSLQRIVRIQAIKPDGIITDINATSGGNLKMSLEELETDVSSNSNSQLNVTPFHADGTEGALISGVKYEPGKSGIDQSTEALMYITYEHHEVHSGNHYGVRINKDVANGGTYNIAFTTPNTTKWAHMVFAVNVELEAGITLYENITSFTGGTPITPTNSNRNSVNTSGIIDMEYDSVPTLGSPTTICNMVLGSGRASGGAARGSEEFVLKQNTTYYLEISNQATGATNEVNIFLNWYEHTDKY